MLYGEHHRHHSLLEEPVEVMERFVKGSLSNNIVISHVLSGPSKKSEPYLPFCTALRKIAPLVIC